MLVARISGVSFKSKSGGRFTPKTLQPELSMQPFDLFSSVLDRVLVGRSSVLLNVKEKLAFKDMNALGWAMFNHTATRNPLRKVDYDPNGPGIVNLRFLLEDKKTPFIQVTTTKDGLAYSIRGPVQGGAMSTIRFDEDGYVIGHPSRDTFLERSLVGETRRHRRPTLIERCANLSFPPRKKVPKDIEKS